MQKQTKTAREVTEDLLNRSQIAFLTDDFDAFADCLALPYQIETFEGQRTLETREELHRLFLAVRMHHHKTGVTDMDRHVIEAAYTDAETVKATFETRLLNGNVLTQKPYPVFCIIKRTGNRWVAQHMSFAIEDNPDHNKALLSTGA